MLNKINKETLLQLKNILEQLTNQEFAQKLNVLNQSSIGQHTRHILEFYICFFEGLDTKVINYDLRKRDYVLEMNVNYAIEVINKLILQLSLQQVQGTNLLQQIEIQGEIITVNTTIDRELLYLIEHNIHHFAILNIGIKSFVNINIPKDFGMAYSTIAYSKSISEAI